jgi:hypothetical protein
MRSVVIGEHIPGPLADRPSAGHFECETTDGDGARLMVVDHCGLADLDDLHRALDAVDVCVSPHRTCVGLAVATALALAAAKLGNGDFIDIEIMMLQPPVSRPDRVIELTKLPDNGSDFVERCERYMRQFVHLNGWPRTVRLIG